ncbi:MAG: hypothetical protein IJ504_00875 [Bacteroidales bacterium]|nr:hypothetical protein [Bacteroidales bacterium]
MKQYRHIKRCNPIDARYIDNDETARKVAAKIVFHISPKYQSYDDFEVKNKYEIDFIALAILMFKKIGNTKYCTIPHLREFFKQNPDEVLEVLHKNTTGENNFLQRLQIENETVKKYLCEFIESIGILLTRRISIVNDWMLTGDDFDKAEIPYYPPTGSTSERIIEDLYSDREYSPFIMLDDISQMHLKTGQNIIEKVCTLNIQWDVQELLGKKVERTSDLDKMFPKTRSTLVGIVGADSRQKPEFETKYWEELKHKATIEFTAALITTNGIKNGDLE